MLTARTSCRLAKTVLAGGAVGAALLVAPFAHADTDPTNNPPNCTSADLEGVRSGVDAATSAYLFTHPDLNTYVSGLSGQTREQVASKMHTYLASHRQEHDDVMGIRQPLVDLKNRCGGVITLTQKRRNCGRIVDFSEIAIRPQSRGCLSWR